MAVVQQRPLQLRHARLQLVHLGRGHRCQLAGVGRHLRRGEPGSPGAGLVAEPLDLVLGGGQTLGQRSASTVWPAAAAAELTQPAPRRAAAAFAAGPQLALQRLHLALDLDQLDVQVHHLFAPGRSRIRPGQYSSITSF